LVLHFWTENDRQILFSLLSSLSLFLHTYIYIIYIITPSKDENEKQNAKNETRNDFDARPLPRRRTTLFFFFFFVLYLF